MTKKKTSSTTTSTGVANLLVADTRSSYQLVERGEWEKDIRVREVGTETNPSQRGYERYERVGEPVDGDFECYSRSSGDCFLSRWELVILGLGI